MRRTVAVVVSVAVLASGCTSAGGAKTTTPTPTPVVTSPAAAVVNDAPLSVAGERQTLSAFASVGVATVADEKSTVPVVAVVGQTVFELTSWQLTNLTEAAAAGTGISGADLNTMLPMPADSPQLDDIIGGWVIGRGDPAAVTAAGLIGTQSWLNPEQVVFPVAVLTLFMADFLQHTAAPAAAAPATHTSGTSWQQGRVTVEDADLVHAPCTTIQNFVDMVLDKVFNLLHLDPTEVSDYLSGKVGAVAGAVVGTVVGILGGWLTSFWNHTVDLAKQAVQNVLKELTQPVLNVLATVIGGLGIITTIVSYLKPWKMPVTADPALNKFSIDPKPYNEGTFTVAVDPNAEIEEWPPQMVNCAQAINAPLPTLSRAGAPVTWTIDGDPGVATSTQLTGSLEKDLTHTMTYRTGHESPQLAAKGVIQALSLSVTVKVRRTEVEQLRNLVTAFVTGQVPGIVAPVLNPIITSYINWATSILDLITAVTGHDTIVVTHHIPKPPVPCSSATTAIPAGTYSGPITATVILSLHAAGQLTVDGSSTTTVTGAVTVTSDGAKVTGRLVVKGSGSAGLALDQQGVATDKSVFTLIGAISGAAADPLVNGRLAGTDEVGGAGNVGFHVGLHVTKVSCSSISGDMVALFRDLEKRGLKYITVTGSGAWTAQRTS